MSEAIRSRLYPPSAGLILAGAMCVVPFLQPRHFPPIRTFYDEWLAFALGTAAIALTVFARRNSPLQVPSLALWLGLFSLTLLVRGLCGQAAYPQASLLWALYALFAGTLVILGYDLATRFGREQVCDILAAFLLAGALLNSIAGVLQVVGIPRAIDSFVAYLHSTRAIGNVGQANLYANYLALGEASLVYLFARGKIGGPASIAAGLLLLSAAALGASRSSFVFLGCFALLGGVALRRGAGPPARQLGGAAMVFAGIGMLLLWLIPASLSAAGFKIEGGFDRSTPSEWHSGDDASTGLRLLVWELAWRLFSTAPWLGVSPGEFAGAGFAYGLRPELSAGEIWTSPHNLILQLLAETGLLGTVPILAGLLLWARSSVGEILSGPNSVNWWIAACVGVEIIHALLEYPLWYAHFLAVTALVLGVGSGGGVSVRPFAARALLAAGACAGAIALGVTLKDYLRFELASPVAAGRSLAPDSDILGDRAILRELGHGLLGPRAELWLFLAFPLDTDELAEKLAVGERVLRVWPSSQVVGRQCVFLALSGRNEAALALLAQGLKSSATQRERIAGFIADAPLAARLVLQPALESTPPRPP